MTRRATERHTLSTGHAVAVPLETEAAATALVLSADATRADEWLPDGLVPVRVAPGRTTVTLLSVDYRRIGDDVMEPYEEFGVLLAATPAAERALPELGALRRGLGGYVAALPVTTEPGRALGVEVWGYPKTVAEVAVTDRGNRRRTAVRDDRGRVVTFETPWRPRFDAAVETASYTDGEGSEGDGRRELRRQPLTLSGTFGARPLGGSYSLGNHPLAERLRGLSPGRPLGALAFDGRSVIGVDRPVGGARPIDGGD